MTSYENEDIRVCPECGTSFYPIADDEDLCMNCEREHTNDLSDVLDLLEIEARMSEE